MELEDLKANWEILSREMDQQKRITNDLVMQLARQKVNKGIKPLIYIEAIGGICLCLILSGFILINFAELGSIVLKVFGVASIGIFIIGSYFSVQFIKRSLKVNLLENTVSETTEAFEKLERLMAQNKRFSAWLMPFTVAFFLPVTLKLISGVDPFHQLDKLFQGLLASVVLAIPVLIMIFRFYRSKIKQTREGLNELKNINNQ